MDGNSFTLELPDGGELKGTMKLYNTINKDQEKRIVYMIDGGGVCSIIDDL